MVRLPLPAPAPPSASPMTGILILIQGHPPRRKTLPRPVHLQAGALHRDRSGPARAGCSRLRLRLWATRLPRPLDGPLLCLDRRRERALHLPHRKGRARRLRHRTFRRLHAWNPCVRTHFAMTEGRRFTEQTNRSPEKFECSVKPRSKDAEALVRATATP